MKTFKLKKLEIVDHQEGIGRKNIELLDGLIINREDENGRWLIEAYMDKSYVDHFQKLYENQAEIVVLATITKKSNDPATFITTIHGVNEIGENINVLFIGKIIDKRKTMVEDLLTELIDKGYQGEELLKKFKEMA